MNISNPSRDEENEAIDAFLSNLSHWGLLRVRNHLQSMRLKFSGLENLPPEIICEIAPHLDLQDLLNCRLVSREWFRSWTHKAVVATLCKDRFPGLMELHPSTKPDALFLKTAVERLKWQRKDFCRRIIPWDPSRSTDEFRNESTLSTPGPAGDALETVPVVYPVQYDDGMIAWQPRQDCVIVDDLRTSSRQRYGLAIESISGRCPQVEGVSRKLVVLAGYSNTDRTIFNKM